LFSNPWCIHSLYDIHGLSTPSSEKFFGTSFFCIHSSGASAKITWRGVVSKLPLENKNVNFSVYLVFVTNCMHFDISGITYFLDSENVWISLNMCIQVAMFKCVVLQLMCRLALVHPSSAIRFFRKRNNPGRSTANNPLFWVYCLCIEWGMMLSSLVINEDGAFFLVILKFCNLLS